MSQGHAAVRFTNPTTGGDVMPTIRAEFHRLRAGATTEAVREVGSSVWQVFEGSRLRGPQRRNPDPGEGRPVRRPVLGPVVPAGGDREFDLFRFSDAPIFERLNFNRTYIEGRTK